MARAAEQKAAQLTVHEARNRVREAEIAADYSQQELDRLQKLYAEKLLPLRDLEKAEAETAKLRASVATLQSAALRIPAEQATRDRERDVRLQRLQEEMTKLAAERETTKAAVERLRYEIERRRIRAAVDGRIAEAAPLRAGAVVWEGEKLGSIVPSGRLLVVAQYPAEAAFGRIRIGQPGTLRLEAFPWAEYGTVSAAVSGVAQEVRDGKVRVELNVDNRSSFRGHLQHGMPGTLEISVERLSPLSLVSRTSGQWLTAHR
jgi:membrane fusion protein (multidrug efflux system)